MFVAVAVALAMSAPDPAATAVRELEVWGGGAGSLDRAVRDQWCKASPMRGIDLTWPL